MPFPDLGLRQDAARQLVGTFRAGGDGGTGDTGEQNRIEAFARETDGMTLRAMREVTRLSRDRGIPADRISDAVQIFKLGVEENPWRRPHLRRRIKDGEASVAADVIGQPRAVQKTFDILKRAVLGLSGAQAASSAGRPRGVIFFAGPTGVGKTELAKRVAEVLFGSTDSYLRFDMSEFAAEHAADRLIGAPPGYVGFEAGGELTSEVRRQPFRVVLFDEIEKAHPAILDKFLQILEDGRLTDGQGITTHFSECVLIFTSNLGVMTHDQHTGRRQMSVEPGVGYDELESRVRSSIHHHFVEKIGRPELLNRFGDNFVVFDFISPAAAAGIFDKQLQNICHRVAEEHGVLLDFAPEVTERLRRWSTADLHNGGRGIGNELESLLVNPLARDLFDREPPLPHILRVNGITRAADGTVSLTTVGTPRRSSP